MPKHLVKQHNTWFYQRRVPKRLKHLPQFQNKTIIKFTLQTDSLNDALKLRDKHDAALEAASRNDIHAKSELVYQNMVENMEDYAEVEEQAYEIEENLCFITLGEMLGDSEELPLITKLLEQPLESVKKIIQCERLDTLKMIATYYSLRAKHITINDDYFALVNEPSEELSDMQADEEFFSNYTIDKYLSFSERLTLRHLSEQTRILRKFEAKFDELFSQDDVEAKKRFLDAMENTVLTK